MLVNGKVAFIPINYRERRGKAKAPTWRQGFRALFAIIGIARRFNPVVLFGLIAAVALILGAFLLIITILQYLLHGTFLSNYALASLMFFVIGRQGPSLATIGFMLRRLERKLIK